MVKLARSLAAMAVLAATLVVATAGPASACSCAGDLDEQDHFDIADNVWIGEVDRVHPRRDNGLGPAVTIFRVETVYKGDAVQRQAVVTPANTDCGVEFGAGRHLVYSRNDSRLVDEEPGFQAVDLCGGSRTLGDVEEPDIDAAGISPSIGGPPTADEIAAQLGDPRSSLFPEAFIFGGVLAFVLGMIFWLNRKGRTVT